MSALVPGVSSAQVNEYALKAVYLLHVINLTEWPADAFTDAAEPLRTCVLGRDPFGAVLDETMRTERVSGRSVVVQRLRRMTGHERCHVLFVADDVRDVRVTLSSLARSPVLTVGESDAFWTAGGMIRMAVHDRKLRVDANAHTAREAGLILGSRLMQVARQRVPPS